MPSKKPTARFSDIIYNIDAIARYTAGMDEQGFIADDLRVDAVERCLSRLSEAATKIGTLAEQLELTLPWRKIRDFGNFLRHEYDTIERTDLWAITRDELTPLRAASERAIKRIHQGLDRDPPEAS